MVGLIRDSEADDRFRALLMWTFTSVAGLLAAVGLFGVTARVVAARARELGIRSALGANSNGLIRLVLIDGLRSAAVGLVLGLLAVSWAVSLIGQFLYEIHPRDLWTFSGATALSMSVCFVAALLPARRVTNIDLTEVLAEE